MSETAESTPGPWECRISNEVAYIRSVPSDVLLAYIGECALEGDPALMIAAPDLLAANAQAIYLLELVGLTGSPAYAALKSAAAKAEGRDA